MAVSFTFASTQIWFGSWNITMRWPGATCSPLRTNVMTMRPSAGLLIVRSAMSTSWRCISARISAAWAREHQQLTLDHLQLLAAAAGRRERAARRGDVGDRLAVPLLRLLVRVRARSISCCESHFWACRLAARSYPRSACFDVATDRCHLGFGRHDAVGFGLVFAERFLVDLPALRAQDAPSGFRAFSAARAALHGAAANRDRRRGRSPAPFFTSSPSMTFSSVIQPDTRLEIVTTSPSMRASST